MKVKFYIFAVAVIMAAVFSGCKEKPEEIWLNEGSVTTGVASEIWINYAKLEGNVSSFEECEIIEKGFYYDTVPEMSSINKVLALEDFTVELSNLKAGTTYYYYAFATAYGKTKDGDVKMFKTMSPEGDLYGHQYVDLGLPSGNLWAICNVGANEPYEYGGQFEQENVLWGGNWQLPEYEDMQELIGVCASEWTTMNGIYGRIFTGTNGKSIFLPASGRNNGSEVGTVGYYWTNYQVSNHGLGNAYLMYYMKFNNNSYNIVRDDQYDKRSIRPCCPR